MPTFTGDRTAPWRKTYARFAIDVLDELNGALRQEQDRQGLTKARIADRLGIHRSEVTKLLNGRRRNMTMESIAALAWALGRDIDFRLIGEHDEGAQCPEHRCKRQHQQEQYQPSLYGLPAHVFCLSRRPSTGAGR
mgnify:CR=1 FL=1